MKKIKNDAERVKKQRKHNAIMQQIKHIFFEKQAKCLLFACLFVLLFGSAINISIDQPKAIQAEEYKLDGKNPISSLIEWSTQSADQVTYVGGTGSLVGTSNVTEAIEQKEDEKFVRVQKSGNHQEQIGAIFSPFGDVYPHMNATSKIIDVNIQFGGLVNSTNPTLGNLSSFEVIIILNNSYWEKMVIFGGMLDNNQYGELNFSISESLIEEMNSNHAIIQSLNFTVFSQAQVLVTNTMIIDYVRVTYGFAQSPDAPDFSIESLPGGEINITFQPNWNGGDNIANYSIYRSTTEGQLGTLVHVSEGWHVSYYDSGLTLGQIYYYIIRAGNRAGESGNSTQKSALSRARPGPPTLNSLTNHQNGNVELIWTAGAENGAPILEYFIFRSTIQNDINAALVGTANGNVTAWNDTTISTYNVTYYYRVGSRNEAGNSTTLSNERNIRPFKAPSAPTIDNVEAGQGNNTITWTESSDYGGSTTVSYILWWGIESDNLNNSIPLTASPFIHANLSSYLYYYVIEARNHLGWGTNSTMSTGQPSGSPTKVRNLNATVGNYFVNLTWIAPQFDGGNPVSEYRIYRRLGNEAEVLIAHSITNLEYNDTSMELYGEYRYRVVAVNIYGEGDPEYLFATPKTKPMKPTTINVLTGFRSIVLNWEEPIDGGYNITHYQIMVKNSSGDPYPLIIQIDRTYNHTDLTPGMNYTYWISALNDLGWGFASDPIVAWPDYVPSPPIGIEAQSSWTSISFSWYRPTQYEGVSIPTKFYIYRGTSNNTLLQIGTINALNLNKYNDTDAEPGVKYYYAIASYNQYGIGTRSEIITAYRYVKMVLNTETTKEGPKLSWTAVENAAKYAIFRGRDQMVKIEGEAPIAGDLTDLIYTDTSLEMRGIYYYVVVAYDDEGLIMGMSEAAHEMYGGADSLQQIMEFMRQFGIYIGIGVAAIIGIGVYKWRKENAYMKF